MDFNPYFPCYPKTWMNIMVFNKYPHKKLFTYTICLYCTTHTHTHTHTHRHTHTHPHKSSSGPTWVSHGVTRLPLCPDLIIYLGTYRVLTETSLVS